MATELCSANLQDLIDGSYKGPSIEGGLSFLMYQVTSGVQYLHFLKIVHGDLKATNILISVPKGDSCPVVKLTDFGLLHVEFDDEKNRFLPAYTKGWMCPNDGLNEDGKRRSSFDIFALGLVIGFSASNGVHPFNRDLERAHKQIKNRKPMTLTKAQLDETFRLPAFWMLLRKMLDFDATQRPTASAILNSSIFNKQQKNQDLIDFPLVATSSRQLSGEPAVKKMRLSFEENQRIIELPSLTHAADSIEERNKLSRDLEFQQEPLNLSAISR